jgi:hypothetical protein
MKFSTVRDLFYALTGDSPSAPVYFPDATVLAYGTTAIARACAMTDCTEGRQDLFVTAGVGEYALASDCRRVYRVTFGGDRIVPTLKYKLRMLMDNWDQLIGLPTHYYLDGLNQRIGLWKKPSTTTSDGSVTYAGSYPFGDLSSTNDPTITANQSFGGVVAVSGDAFSVGGDSAEIFYVAEPAALVDPDSDMGLPMWAAPYVLYSMLSQAYGSDTQLRNLGLSGYWAEAADAVLIRLRQRTGNRCMKMTGDVRPRRLPKGLFVTYPTPITE